MPFQDGSSAKDKSAEFDADLEDVEAAVDFAEAWQQAEANVQEHSQEMDDFNRE